MTIDWITRDEYYKMQEILDSLPGMWYSEKKVDFKLRDRESVFDKCRRPSNFTVIVDKSEMGHMRITGDLSPEYVIALKQTILGVYRAARSGKEFEIQKALGIKS